ncbi:MAG: hypothetical protein FJW40_09790, partial [Acidobacteria bacterium]|nr:hypothetical protein [Acidobacteriota bacterium]
MVRHGGVSRERPRHVRHAGPQHGAGPRDRDGRLLAVQEFPDAILREAQGGIARRGVQPAQPGEPWQSDHVANVGDLWTDQRGGGSEDSPDRTSVHLLRRKHEYPAIRAEAQQLGAAIYFGDESSVRSDYHSGTTWGKKGQTPVVQRSAKRAKVNMLSAITAKGELRFM